jgi:hypothetical protein
MDIENRVKYYMGKWYSTKIEIKNAEQYKILPNRLVDTILLLNKDILIMNPHINRYSKYLIDNATLFKDNLFLYALGDVIHTGKDLPIICKATNLTDQHIITKLNHKRHWRFVNSVEENDIAYHLKKNSIVWRGNTTNYIEKPVRICAVNKYDNHTIFDIGFYKYCQGHIVTNLKPRLSLKEQLEYKFILSIEGNDVASGLKWQLYSNSVVIMAKPTCISWAMEDKLMPYVHYIPVKDDYSDLEEIFEWGLTHEAECMEISKNAKAFIEQFLDEEKEQEIHRRIIKRYIQNVTIKSAEIQEILHDN